MKKTATLLVLVFAFTLTAQAQREHKRGDFEKLSVTQQTDLAVKRMTLKLDLTSAQQNKIKPLLANKIAKRKEMQTKRKAMKESGKKPKLSADERYQKENTRLDEMIAFKADMKRILTPEQFEKFGKLAKHKMGRMERKVKKRKAKKERHNKDDK